MHGTEMLVFVMPGSCKVFCLIVAMQCTDSMEELIKGHNLSICVGLGMSQRIE